MSKPEFYKAPPRWHFLAALIGAVAIEVAAVAAASLAKDENIPTDNGVSQDSQDQSLEVFMLDERSESTPPPLEDLPPPLPLPTTEITEFVLSAPSSLPLSVKSPKPTVKAAVSRAARAHVGTINLSSGRSKMTFSPRPAYPFEARRAKQTGSGKFLLLFDANGGVTEVDVVQSTGSAILDQVSSRALQQWRCQPGVYERVYVPITFTLQGAQLWNEAARLRTRRTE